jgi:hypothetical protein
VTPQTFDENDRGHTWRPKPRAAKSHNQRETLLGTFG